MTDSFWHNADSAKENASLNLQQISITLQTSYKKMKILAINWSIA